MKLHEIAAALQAQTVTWGPEADGADITAGYVSDLLSDVLANAPQGAVLVTVQSHLNVVAVAVHAELAAVIFAAGRMPDEATVERARQERMSLLISPMNAFEIVGRLYQLGVRGNQT